MKKPPTKLNERVARWWQSLLQRIRFITGACVTPLLIQQRATESMPIRAESNQSNFSPLLRRRTWGAGRRTS